MSYGMHMHAQFDHVRTSAMLLSRSVKGWPQNTQLDMLLADVEDQVKCRARCTLTHPVACTSVMVG